MLEALAGGWPAAMQKSRADDLAQSASIISSSTVRVAVVRSSNMGALADAR